MKSELPKDKSSGFRPKYEDLTDLLRKKIQTQASGTRLPSMRSLMRRHNLSLQTVKSAIRKLEEEKLIVAKRGSGIFVSEQRATKLVFYHRSRTASYVEDKRENSLQAAMKAAGWHMDVHRHDELSDNDIIMAPQPRACAHIVSQDMVNMKLNLIRNLSQQEVPLVVIGRETDAYAIDFITYNDQQIISLLIKHLKSLGHSRLGFLINEPLSFFEISRRREYFNDILELMDMPPGTIIDCKTQPGEDSALTAYDGLKDFLITNTGPLPFTALIVSSAAGAPGTLRALHESHLRVPQDCSVAACGASKINAFCIPSITDAGIKMDRWGEWAVRLLQKRFDGNDSPCLGMTIPAQLTIRESTAPPPARS